MNKIFLASFLVLFSAACLAQQIDMSMLCSIDPSQLALMDLTAVYQALGVSSIEEIQALCGNLAESPPQLDLSQIDLSTIDPEITGQITSLSSIIAADGTLTSLGYQVFDMLGIDTSLVLGPDFKVTPEGRAFIIGLLEMLGIGGEEGSGIDESMGPLSELISNIIENGNDGNPVDIQNITTEGFPFSITSFDLESYVLPDGTLTALGRTLLQFLGFDVQSLLDENGKLTPEGRQIIIDYLMEQMNVLGIEYDDFFDDQGNLYDPLVDIFNENTEMIPENMTDLFGDQLINLTIELDDGEDFNVGLALEGMQLVQAKNKHFDSATVSAKVTERDFREIATSSNPFEKLQDKMDEGKVNISVHGFWNNVKFSLLKGFLWFEDAFEWATSSFWKILIIAFLVILIGAGIFVAIVSITRTR